ncbi:Conserved_hypothetical protein [Hexamita inflata]|uniref:Uncharacterized protein n=1 Tax=Hexamita inflata TaxID=28002 RepID=A0ABP1JT16_9EUKA
MKKRSVPFEQFYAAAKQLFEETFQRTFTSDKEIVDFHTQLPEAQRKTIRWEEIGRATGVDARQAYKYFINTFAKAALDKWPKEVKDRAYQLCEELFAKYRTDAISEEEIRTDIIQEVNDRMHLKEMKEFHYDTMYFCLRNKIHLLCSNASPRKRYSYSLLANVPPETKNNSSDVAKQEPKKAIIDSSQIQETLAKLFKDK